MKKLLILTFLVSGFSFAAITVGDGADKKDVVKISTLLETPKKYLDKVVTVEGMVVKVCARSGCKMMLASDKKYEDLMIKSKSKKMLFPLSARGKKAIAKGVFSRFAKKKDHKDCDENYTYMISATGAMILE